MQGDALAAQKNLGGGAGHPFFVKGRILFSLDWQDFQGGEFSWEKKGPSLWERPRKNQGM